MNYLLYFLVVLVAAVVTMVVMPLAMRIAKRFDVIDEPDLEGRRVNKVAIPRTGGIAICVGVLVACAGVYAWIQIFRDPELTYSVMPGINYWGVLLAAVVMFATGLVDDFVDLKPGLKFLGQVVAAIIVCMSGVLFSHIIVPFAEVDMSLGWVAYPITVFYLVAFANIINLIDGLDGLAAGISGISAVALAISALSKGGFDAAFLSIAILGACLGFLRYNFYPAKIFMGDSGALTLGFLLGVASLFGVVRTPALVSLLVPVIIAGIAVIDTFTSIVRRLRAGQSIAQADDGHIHHRFIALGYSQRTTVLIMYLLSILLTVCALLIGTQDGIVRWTAVAVLGVIVVVLIWRLGLTKSILSHYYYKRPPHEHHEHHDEHERQEHHKKSGDGEKGV